jgi:hypothetical protein
VDINSDRQYFPLSARLKIPATTKPESPYVITLQCQARNLEYIEITLPQAGVLQDLGVKVTSNEGYLYPAIGSYSDSNFITGNDSYGAMPTSGSPLVLPFNRRLFGAPYTLRFEFYNDGAGTVAVNVLAVLSEPINRVVIPDRKKDAAEAAVNVS